MGFLFLFSFVNAQTAFNLKLLTVSTVKVLISFRSLKRAGENMFKLFQPFERNLNLSF